MVHAFKHSVGDGLHYITNDFHVYENGAFQFGASSEPCVIINAQIICSLYNLPSLVELWNIAYPNEEMTNEDFNEMYYYAAKYTNRFLPHSPEDLADALDDLEAIGRMELADLLRMKMGLKKGSAE